MNTKGFFSNRNQVSGSSQQEAFKQNERGKEAGEVATLANTARGGISDLEKGGRCPKSQFSHSNHRRGRCAKDCALW